MLNILAAKIDFIPFHCHFCQTGFEQLTNENRSSECTNKEVALRSLQAMKDMLGDNQLQWLQQCPLPCEQIVYDAKLLRYHVHNLVGHDEEFINQLQKHGVVLSISYGTFAIHEQVETLVIDTGNFLSQIGGNLGLFLGVSCMSLLTGVIHFARLAVQHWRSCH